MFNIIATFVVVLMTISPALAGNESVNLVSKHKICGELLSYSKVEGCFYNVYVESDKYLNKEYSELIRYLDGLDSKVHKDRLVNTQRAWIKFRDLDCEFDSGGQSTRLNICLSERTIQRLKELENYNVPYAMGCNGCPW